MILFHFFFLKNLFLHWWQWQGNEKAHANHFCRKRKVEFRMTSAVCALTKNGTKWNWVWSMRCSAVTQREWTKNRLTEQIANEKNERIECRKFEHYANFFSFFFFFLFCLTSIEFRRTGKIWLSFVLLVTKMLILCV